MDEGVIDVIIPAGTKNYKGFEIDGKEVPKHLLTLDGAPLVMHVIRAALGYEKTRRIYVPTDERTAAAIIDSFGKPVPKNVHVVPDQGSFIMNVLATFCDYLLPDAGFEKYDLVHNHYRAEYLQRNPGADDISFLFMPSDAPLIRAEDIADFRRKPLGRPSADFIIGFVDEDSMSALEAEVERTLSGPETKTALFPLEDTAIRWSNLGEIKPLKASPEIWNLAQQLYDHRYLLDKKGEKNTRNWWRIAKALGRYTLGNTTRRPTIVKGFARGAIHFLSLYAGHRYSNPYLRLLLHRKDFETVATDLSGGTLTVKMKIGGYADPSLDIDTKSMYDMLAADGEMLYRKIRCRMRTPLQRIIVKKMWNDAAWKDVERQHPDWFEGEPERFIEF